MDQLESMKANLPEGEQIEDGSEEELGFFKDMFKKLNEQVDPALQTVVNNINRTNIGQIKYVVNDLKEKLKVDHWQQLTQTGSDQKEKLEAWNKLRTESIRELFDYLYSSQVFFTCSMVAFAMTGKQLFELNAGKGKFNNIADIATQLQKIASDNSEKTPEEIEKEKKEEEENNKVMEIKEKVMNIIHKHFMVLIFDVLTNFITDIKTEFIHPTVDEVMKEVPLKLKLKLDQFKSDVFDKIYNQINDQLLSQDNYKESQDSQDEETDFESDSDSEHTSSSIRLMSEDKKEELKQLTLSKYRNILTGKLVEYFNQQDLVTYMKNIAEEIKTNVPDF